MRHTAQATNSAQQAPNPSGNPEPSLQGSLAGIDLEEVMREEQKRANAADQAPARGPKVDTVLAVVKESFRQLLMRDTNGAIQYLKGEELVPQDMEKLIADPNIQKALNQAIRVSLNNKLSGSEPAATTDPLQELMLMGVIRERQLHCSAVVVVADKLYQAGKDLDNGKKIAAAALALTDIGELAAFPVRSADGKVEYKKPQADTLTALQVEALATAGPTLNRYQLNDLISNLSHERPGLCGDIDKFLRAHGSPLGLNGGSHAMATSVFLKDLQFAAALSRFSEDISPAGAKKFLNALSYYKIDFDGMEDRTLQELMKSKSDADKSATLDVLTSADAKAVGLDINNAVIVQSATKRIGEISASARHLTATELAGIEYIRKIFIEGRPIK